MPAHAAPPSSGGPVTVRIHVCVRDDEQIHLPKRRRAPQYLPIDAPMPRVGELIYLSSSSAWKVTDVIHEWRSPSELRIEIWTEYAGGARAGRAPGFALTQ